MSDPVVEFDKTAISVGSLFDGSEERAYWQRKTPLERLNALEFLRQAVYGYDPITARVQRVLTVIELSQS